MIEKIICDDLANDKKLGMVIDMCCLAFNKLVTIRESFVKFNCPMTAEVVAYCDAAYSYFNVIQMISVLRLNLLEESGGTEKKKGIETLYVENNILANELFNAKQMLEGAINSASNGGQHFFVSTENYKHTLNHFTSALVGDMKKCIGTYQATKDKIDANRFKQYDLNTIKAH